MVMEAVVSDTIAQKELAQEVVYFAQVRTNNQITIPKECMEAKNLKQGDVIAIAVLKIVDGTVTWMNLKSRLSGRGGETKNE